MRFDNYSYLYPPRPEKAVPRAMLSTYERMGYIAQAKKKMGRAMSSRSRPIVNSSA